MERGGAKIQTVFGSRDSDTDHIWLGCTQRDLFPRVLHLRHCDTWVERRCLGPEPNTNQHKCTTLITLILHLHHEASSTSRLIKHLSRCHG